MRIWTETPLAEMWNHLRYLKSPSNVYSLLCGKTRSGRREKWPESKELEERSFQIAACMRQADEYYKGADAVGLATQPLLQFYGIQALAKAVILSRERNVSLADLSYHGLSTRPSTASPEIARQLRSYSDDPLSWSLEREFAITNNGVFFELCRVIEVANPEIGQTLRFKELLSLIPDLTAVFYRHYGEPSRCFFIYGTYRMEPDLKMEIKFSYRQNEHLDGFREVFPEFYTDFEEILSDGRIKRFQSSGVLEGIPSFCRFEKGTVVGDYLVRPVAWGLHRSICVLYAAMFILSIVVRYKPAFWLRLLEGKKSGSASIAEALCTVAKRRLPNDALEAIWQEDFVYKTPGYMA